MGAGRCARLAPALLIHVNLLLCAAAGAGLATAARLKWDPSTYVVLRALFPHEYRAAAGALCAASAALLALAHLAAAALFCRPSNRRLARALLVTYAVCMVALVCGEAAWAAWSGARVAAWLRGTDAARLQEILQLREYLRPFLAFLGRWHPVPDHIKDLIQEAEEDAPRNLYAAAAGALLAALLQPAAALLALVCAAGSAPPRASPLTGSLSFSSTSADPAHTPLKAAYRDGKLVIV